MSIKEANVKPINPPPVHDSIQKPKHYQLLPGVGVYDIRQALAAKANAAGATLDQFSDYDRAVEYMLRMWEKNGVEDAQKAAWYINKLVGKLNGRLSAPSSRAAISTERELAIEEMMKVAATNRNNLHGCFDALYRAGYRKESK